jgi:PST family polysaccharide transporter
MLTFGGHFTGTNLLNFFGRNVDNILIGKFWGPEQLGLYSRAYQLLLLPLQQILNPVAAVALPALSRLTDAPDRYRKAYLSIIEKMAMITMPAVTLACVVSDWLVSFVLGPRWEESGRIFMFLGVGAIMQPITRTSYWLFATQERTREMINWGAVSTAISVGSILLGLYWGAIGVAISYGATELLIITPLMFWFTGRRGPVATLDFYKTLFPSFCASAAVLVTVVIARRYLNQLDVVAARLAIVAALGVFVSFGVFLAIPKGRNGISSFRQLMANSLRFNE